MFSCEGGGAFRGLFAWDRVRMSDRKVVRFPASFKFSGCLITKDVFSLRFFVGIRVIIVVEEGGGVV